MTILNPQAPAASTAAHSGTAVWMKVKLAQSILNTAAQRFWTRSDVPLLFPSFLVELYSLVSCSVPLMRAGLTRARELAREDPLAKLTADYLERHIVEESHHDEWLLDDLGAAGMDRAALIAGVPSAEVARLAGAQYCWIHHAHPAALFGYLAVIEGNPPLPQHLEEIRLRTELPRESFRCLQAHAEDDIAHLTELRSTVVGLPLTMDQAALISTSAFATMQGLIAIFEELTSTHQSS